jgi:hypothetical protein
VLLTILVAISTSKNFALKLLHKRMLWEDNRWAAADSQAEQQQKQEAQHSQPE